MKSGVNRSKLATSASQDFFLGIRPFLNNLAVPRELFNGNNQHKDAEAQSF